MATMRFGDKLKELRISQNMTQKHIASLISLSPSVYSRLENNERKLKQNLLKTLSEIYNIDESVLYKYWIADKIYDILDNVQNPLEILILVENYVDITGQNKHKHEKTYLR